MAPGRFTARAREKRLPVEITVRNVDRLQPHRSQSPLSVCASLRRESLAERMG